jgi:hypothetical protein
MTNNTTKPDSSQLEAETAPQLFDNWFDPCENACNSDPIRVSCRSLINHVNRLAGKGSHFARKMTPPKFRFSNEINALGEFSGGIMIGGVFTTSWSGTSRTPARARSTVRSMNSSASSESARNRTETMSNWAVSAAIAPTFGPTRALTPSGEAAWKRSPPILERVRHGEIRQLIINMPKGRHPTRLAVFGHGDLLSNDVLQDCPDRPAAIRTPFGLPLLPAMNCDAFGGSR